MNFFKSSKYSLSEGKSTKKTENAPEHFHRTDLVTNNDIKPTKNKAPPKPSDVQLPTGSFSFVSIVNKTEATLFLLNPRDEYIKEVLPASEGLILFSKPKETLEYEIDFDGKNVKRFSLIVQKTNENWKLKVDWHDMLEIPGYRFKPVSSSDEWLELTSTKKDCVEILLEKELKKL